MRATFGTPCAATIRGMAAVAMADAKKSRRFIFSPFGEFIRYGSLSAEFWTHQSPAEFDNVGFGSIASV
jgi:hypothetical protein